MSRDGWGGRGGRRGFDETRCPSRDVGREREVSFVIRWFPFSGGDSAFVTLPEYALVDPVGGLAVGLLQTGRTAAVEALTAITEVLLALLRALLALALPPHVPQPPAEVPYHLLYAMMMMVMVVLLVLVGRAGRRGRRLAAARRMMIALMMMMVVMVQSRMLLVLLVMAAVTVYRVVHGTVGRVGAVGRAVGRGAVRVRGTDRAARHVPLV